MRMGDFFLTIQVFARHVTKSRHWVLIATGTRRDNVNNPSQPPQSLLVFMFVYYPLPNADPSAMTTLPRQWGIEVDFSEKLYV